MHIISLSENFKLFLLDSLFSGLVLRLYYLDLVAIIIQLSTFISHADVWRK